MLGRMMAHLALVVSVIDVDVSMEVDDVVIVADAGVVSVKPDILMFKWQLFWLYMYMLPLPHVFLNSHLHVCATTCQIWFSDVLGCYSAFFPHLVYKNLAFYKGITFYVPG